MKLILRTWYLVLLSLILTACEGTTFQSSVPAYPVRIIIDTKMGPFVHFQPTNLNSYIIVNKDGYWMDEKFVLPTTAMDTYGYGGVIIYVSMNGYVAYDLACPNCAAKGKKRPCSMDGIFAECPECGEQYELASGYALPRKGICKEALRKLSIMNSDGKLTITQGQ